MSNVSPGDIGLFIGAASTIYFSSDQGWVGTGSSIFTGYLIGKFAEWCKVRVLGDFGFMFLVGSGISVPGAATGVLLKSYVLQPLGKIASTTVSLATSSLITYAIAQRVIPGR